MVQISLSYISLLLALQRVGYETHHVSEPEDSSRVHGSPMALFSQSFVTVSYLIYEVTCLRKIKCGLFALSCPAGIKKMPQLFVRPRVNLFS